MKFEWEDSQGRAWKDSKRLCVESDILAQFDQDREIALACNPSQYGLGAVLSHKMDGGSERLITFASKTLSPNEKNYSQIIKEGLAVILGLKI